MRAVRHPYGVGRPAGSARPCKTSSVLLTNRWQATCFVAMPKEAIVAFVDGTRVPRRGTAAIAAAVVATALALSGAVPVWAHASPAPSPAKAWQMRGADREVSPRLHGYLLDKGEFTTIDAPGAINTNASDINERGQIVGFYLDAP